MECKEQLCLYMLFLNMMLLTKNCVCIINLWVFFWRISNLVWKCGFSTIELKEFIEKFIQLVANIINYKLRTCYFILLHYWLSFSAVLCDLTFFLIGIHPYKLFQDILNRAARNQIKMVNHLDLASPSSTISSRYERAHDTSSRVKCLAVFATQIGNTHWFLFKMSN